jgi:tetratricopeptide (TPR) repeat protein
MLVHTKEVLVKIQSGILAILFVLRAFPAGDGEVFLREGTAHYYSGDYPKAEAAYLAALEEWKDAPGEQRATVLSDLGVLYAATGRFGDAERVHREALAIRVGLLGPRTAAVASTLTHLAKLYRLAGRLSEAEETAHKALGILRQIPAGADVILADALQTRASIAVQQEKDWDSVNAWISESIELRERRSEAQPGMAPALILQGQAFLKQGRFADSEKSLGRAIELLERGPRDHLAVAYNNLAQTYKLSRRYGDADRCYRKSLSLLKPAVGASHPRYALVELNMADLFRVQQKLFAAEKMYRQALAVLSEHYGPADANVRAAERGLADVTRNNGWLHEALLDARTATR